MRVLLCALLWAVLAQGTFASAPERYSALTGYVLDGTTDSPVPGAVLRLAEINRYTTTDSSGFFEFSGIAEAAYTLEFSHIAYKKYSMTVHLEKNKAPALLVHLYPVTLETGPVVIQGNHPVTKFDDIYETAGVLKGKELEKNLGSTLAATLKNEAGLAVRSMGPAPARPVLRGLGGDRVMITEDGFKAVDLSATSQDHAVAVEPFTIDRVEVIRGPKTLLSNSTTIGGIVNIVRDEIPYHNPGKFTLSGGAYTESVNNGRLGALAAKVPLGDWVLRGEASYRAANNLLTPAGILNNSSLQTDTWSAGTAYVTGRFSAGASIREFNSNYRVPGGFLGAHPNGVQISMFKREINARAAYHHKHNVIDRVEVKAGRTFFSQQEFERQGVTGAEFGISNYSGSVEAVTNAGENLLAGTYGVSGDIRDFSIGGFVFTPPTVARRISVFGYQPMIFNDVSLETAVRYNYDGFTPRAATVSSKPQYQAARHFNTWSASVSALLQLDSRLSIGANISRSSRVPTTEELYSEGPHLAAYSYEVGNPMLQAEYGYGTELFLFRKTDSYSALFTLFYNRLPYYIIPRNSGRMNYQTLLPVYETSGVPAVVKGAEFQTEYAVSAYVNTTATLSYTHGSFSATGNPLPAIPPLKGLLAVSYTAGRFTGSAELEYASRQNRTDEFETPTAGYAVGNVNMQYTALFFETVNNFTLSVQNIFNAEYRNHLSRVKIIMPEAGRNVKLLYRIFL